MAADRVTAIAVEGFKSIARRQRIELRPLTILAGANSSGKTSIMQPVLLLKQTLEAPYDPGALLLDGPYVRQTFICQLLAAEVNKQADSFAVATEWEGGRRLELSFGDPFGTEHTMTVHHGPHDTVHFHANSAFRTRCYLTSPNVAPHDLATDLMSLHADFLMSMIYVPAIRANPERSYKATQIGSRFPGTFENYTASVIVRWQTSHDSSKLQALVAAMADLGLTSFVEATSLDDTRVEIQVGRLSGPQNGWRTDKVSIADVGLGVSQALPVVVALLVAEKGSTVYLEEPELHLHPNAQVAMSKILAEAARRGVTVIAETHSSLLLSGVQTMIARGELSPELVKVHWFSRDPTTGITTVASADLDEDGAFGDWPEDFDDVEIGAEKRYLDAVTSRHFGK